MSPFSFLKGFVSSSTDSEIPYSDNWIPISLDPQSLESLYQRPLDFWHDEYSLFNSALIYPHPLLDPIESFSEPYLRQTSQ